MLMNNKHKIEFENGWSSEETTVVPSTFHISTLPAFQLTCIYDWTSQCSNYINETAGASLNIPYRVDRKSLSSYRKSHQSAPDSGMSSFYIGCVGSAIISISFLLIMMLDFLPNAWLLCLSLQIWIICVRHSFSFIFIKNREWYQQRRILPTLTQ